MLFYAPLDPHSRDGAVRRDTVGGCKSHLRQSVTCERLYPNESKNRMTFAYPCNHGRRQPAQSLLLRARLAFVDTDKIGFAVRWLFGPLFAVVLAQHPPAKNVLINEFMYHPASHNPREKYVELSTAG